MSEAVEYEPEVSRIKCGLLVTVFRSSDEDLQNSEERDLVWTSMNNIENNPKLYRDYKKLSDIYNDPNRVNHRLYINSNLDGPSRKGRMKRYLIEGDDFNYFLRNIETDGFSQELMFYNFVVNGLNLSGEDLESLCRIENFYCDNNAKVLVEGIPIYYE